MRDGMEVGVRGTPTLMVNGEFLVGAQSEESLRRLFEKFGIAD
jgi:protein-disulfide isomerase